MLMSSGSAQKHADTGVHAVPATLLLPCIFHLETCRCPAPRGLRRCPGSTGSNRHRSRLDTQRLRCRPGLAARWTPAPPPRAGSWGQMASVVWPESPTLGVTHLLLPGPVAPVNLGQVTWWGPGLGVAAQPLGFRNRAGVVARCLGEETGLSLHHLCTGLAPRPVPAGRSAQTLDSQRLQEAASC